MEQEKELMSFYDQWRANKAFKHQTSPPGQFQASLLAGDVDMFDLTQDGNMYGEYTRCFYKLNGKDTVFQETPCVTPKIKWKKIDNAVIPHFYPAHEATWKYIQDHYMRSEGLYQVAFTKNSRS